MMRSSVDNLRREVAPLYDLIEQVIVRFQLNPARQFRFEPDSFDLVVV